MAGGAAGAGSGGAARYTIPPSRNADVLARRKRERGGRVRGEGACNAGRAGGTHKSKEREGSWSVT